MNPSIETLYEVVDRDGKLVVHATKSDVYINARSNRQKESKKPDESKREMVREGEQRSREDHCAIGVTRGQTPGLGPALNARWAKTAGAAVIGGLTWWVLCQDDDRLSPATPAHHTCPIP